MCVAGGRRCPGSGTPSAKQRAKRKANRAYRTAVANEIEQVTGDKELAQKVRNLPMTDVADVVTAARLDAESIAKSAGQASYTDKDGHTTTVDVEPAGTTRRTPISEEAKAVLAEVDDKVGAFEPDTEFHTAVLNGDRARQDELRAEAAEDINAAAEEYGNTSLPDLKDHELEEAVEKYQKLVDEAYACTDDRVVQAKAEEMLRVTKDAQKIRGAKHYGNPIDDLVSPAQNDDKSAATDEGDGATKEEEKRRDTENTPSYVRKNPAQLDDLTAATDKDTAMELANDMYERLEEIDPAELSDAELDEAHAQWDELDESVRNHTDDIAAHEISASAGIGLVEEIEFRDQPRREQYEFGDDAQRARVVREWAEDNPTHPAYTTLKGDPSDEDLQDAVAWAGDALRSGGYSEMEKDIARSVYAMDDATFMDHVHLEVKKDRKFGPTSQRYMDAIEDVCEASDNGTDYAFPYATASDKERTYKELERMRKKQARAYGADIERNSDKIVSHKYQGRKLDDMDLEQVKSLREETGDKDLDAYISMRTSMDDFDAAIRNIETDEPKTLQEAVDAHYTADLYGQGVFAATKDPFSRKHVLNTVNFTRARVRRMARTAEDTELSSVNPECLPPDKWEKFMAENEH